MFARERTLNTDGGKEKKDSRSVGASTVILFYILLIAKRKAVLYEAKSGTLPPEKRYFSMRKAVLCLSCFCKTLNISRLQKCAETLRNNFTKRSV